MARRRSAYLRQKLRLYADENFPLEVVEAVRSDPLWRDKVVVRTSAELGTRNRDDGFHLSYCRRHGLVLLTLDADFMDDRRFPFGEESPGIIRIVPASLGDIRTALEMVLSFLTEVPRPQNFAGDSKFQVSNEMVVMRGRDSETRRVKTIRVIPEKTTYAEVMEHFSYLGPG